MQLINYKKSIKQNKAKQKTEMFQKRYGKMAEPYRTTGVRDHSKFL
jgi:hypothetical protein